MILSLSRFSRRKPSVTISLWVVIPIALFVASRLIDPAWIGIVSIPQSESSKAMELLQQKMPDAELEGTFYQGNIVFHSRDGISQHRDAITKYLDRIRDDKSMNVLDVYSPVDRNHASQISRDGTTAYAVVFFRDDIGFKNLSNKVISASDEVRQDLTVEFSGVVFDNLKAPHNEIYGIIAAIIILSLVFGSLVAAGLPIVTALLGVLVGISGVRLLTLVMGMPEVSYHIGAMMGIGVGIDYALFIVTRYKEALHRGKSQHDAIDEAMSTAGVAVFSAGITVVISILGILIVNLDYLNGIAIGVSMCVFFMIMMAITLIPAVLATSIGLKLDKLPLPRKKNKAVDDHPHGWTRWSLFVQRNAVVGVIVGVGILLLISSPILALRIGVTDVGNENTQKTTRRAYDLLADAFGPGFNGPLVVVVDRSQARTPDALNRLMEAVENHETVDRIYPDPDMVVATDSLGRFIEGFIRAREDTSDTPKDEIRRNYTSDGQKGIVAFLVYPKTAPPSEETTQYVHDLRNDIIKNNQKETGIKAYVTGITAGNIDFAEIMTRRIPIFMSSVLFISFFFLLFVFRSVLVAVKAIIMNLLSISASYGVVIAVFQFGWFSRYLGVGTPGPIEPWAPLMLFAILFGLSMDYEVFLISKMKEEYDKTKDNSFAVAHGLASTARVITAAALIMACVFGSFAFAIDRPVKLMGLGLAVAVLLDATVVRMLLVPATMELLGAKNWWLPKWLAKRLPAPKTHVHS